MFKKQKHNIILSFVSHLITIALASYFMRYTNEFNGKMAWILVIFLMMRIILLEDYKRYVSLKHTLKTLKEINKQDEDFRERITRTYKAVPKELISEK